MKRQLGSAQERLEELERLLKVKLIAMSIFDILLIFIIKVEVCISIVISIIICGKAPSSQQHQHNFPFSEA